FSKLDRGLELQWLADRPSVQAILAEVIGAPPGLLEEVTGATLAGPHEQSRRVQLEDLPYAGPIDLTEERLPPGLPALVQLPRSWKRVWWVAPSGAGRSLVGAWLAARRLARYVVARDFGEVAQALEADPGSRDDPVFVEIWSAPEALWEPPDRDGICVAA